MQNCLINDLIISLKLWIQHDIWIKFTWALDRNKKKTFHWNAWIINNHTEEKRLENISQIYIGGGGTWNYIFF